MKFTAEGPKRMDCAPWLRRGDDGYGNVRFCRRSGALKKIMAARRDKNKGRRSVTQTRIRPAPFR